MIQVNERDWSVIVSALQQAAAREKGATRLARAVVEVIISPIEESRTEGAVLRADTNVPEFSR